MELAFGKKPGRADHQQQSQTSASVTRSMSEMMESDDDETILKDLGIAEMLRCRVRYFTDVALIGGKEFVGEAFPWAREQF